MSTLTPNYHWQMPTVGGDATTWGGELNQTIAAIDAQTKTNETGIATNVTAIAAANANIATLGDVVLDSNHLALNSAKPGGATPFNALDGNVNGNLRWVVFPGNAENETGGNAGSNFEIDAYTDAGAYLSTPLKIIRSTGQVLVNGTPVTSLLADLQARVAALEAKG